MFDRYDLMLQYIDKNQQLSFCKYDKHNFCLLKKYCMWCEVWEFSDEEYFNHKERFICELTKGNGDPLKGILLEKDFEEQKSMIEFLYSDIDFLKEAYKLANKDSDDDIENNEKVQKQLDILKNTDIASELLKINYSPDTNVVFHISCVEKGITMQYFENSGLFISVNVNYDLNSKTKVSFEDKLSVYKALADESRLKIVQALAKKDMTPTQLAEVADITLSTVNHHIKKLCECGLIKMGLPENANKGVYFSLSKDFINNLMGEIKNEIQ